MMKGADHPNIDARFLEEIDAALQGCAVTKNAENARTRAPAAGVPLAPILFGQVKVDRIRTAIRRHGVTESSVTLVAEDLLIVRIPDGPGMERHPPASAVLIRRPQIAGGIC